MRIYLAHPISGLSYDEIVAYYVKMRERLSPEWEIMNPMTAKEELRNETKLRAYDYDNPVATNKAIVHRDFWMVSRSDVLYANLLGVTWPSIGCIIELSWAWARQIHTVVAMDFMGPNWHAFVIEMANIIFSGENDAINYLNRLVKGG